jgi:hypothetical protein
MRQTFSASENFLDLANGGVLSILPFRRIDADVDFISTFATFVSGARHIRRIHPNFMFSAKWEWVESTLINVISKLNVVVFDEENILFAAIVSEEEIGNYNERYAKQKSQQY